VIVLIAGGGPPANLVRRLDRIHALGEDTSHRLALHSLDFTAMLLSALLPSAVPIDRPSDAARAWGSGSIPVLSPRPVLAEIEHSGAPPLPSSWDVTSDTIAARIACHLGADSLILVKSAGLPAGATRADAARLGWIDPMFPEAARCLTRVEYLNLRDPNAGLVNL
jgi:aspartokinase-like uncharacterized kinase